VSLNRFEQHEDDFNTLHPQADTQVQRLTITPLTNYIFAFDSAALNQILIGITMYL
jgi:hypothetical protein